MESLSPTDIEFMIYCCMSATFKIYSISSEINNEELTVFATKYFEKDNRLTVVELIKYILTIYKSIKEFSWSQWFFLNYQKGFDRKGWRC